MKPLEKKIKSYLTARGWTSMRPGDIAKSIVIEGAELLELFQWDSSTLGEVKKNPEKMAEVKKELADVFIYALDLSVLLGLDTEKIILDKLVLVEKKYPAKLMKKNAKKNKGSGADPEYWKIKNAHRKK